MRTIKLLFTTLLLVALCTGGSSCDGDSFKQAPLDVPTEESIYNDYINPKDYECLGITAQTGTVFISGLKNNHLWLGSFEYGGSKKKLYEWIDAETINKKQKLYIGYGEHKEFTITSVQVGELKEVDDVGFIARLHFFYSAENDIRSKIITIFKSPSKAKKIYSDYWVSFNEKYKPIQQWYKQSFFIDNCCYSHAGDTLYTVKAMPDENVLPISYEEGLKLEKNSIQRYSYKEAKSVWGTNIAPPFEVSSDAKRTYTLIDRTTNIWKYKVDVTFYDGTKKDFTFTINIENGEIVVEGIKVIGITLNYNMIELDIIDTFQFLANIQPIDATNKNITWKSSNEEIATIYQNGLVKAKSPGETTITATTEEGGFTASSTIVVKIKQDISAYIDADLRINGSNIMGQFWGVIDSKITNNSTESISLVSIEIINDGGTIIYSKQYDDKAVNSKGNHSESIQGLPTLYTPTVKWTYKYNNQEYIISKTSVK